MRESREKNEESKGNATLMANTIYELTSGKRGLVLEKPRLLWVSLETTKTLKIQRLLGRPRRQVPYVRIAQSTPKAF